MKADLTEHEAAMVRGASQGRVHLSPDHREAVRACLRVEHSREISEEEVEAAARVWAEAFWGKEVWDNAECTIAVKQHWCASMRAALLAAQAKRREQING